MNDERDLDPGQERIRALLADLGSPQAPDAASMPPEVAARLDETLAGLVAERSTEAVPANVLPLRRRWVQRGAAAAAAVIVLGVGGVAVADLVGGSADDSRTSAGGVAESATAEEDSG